MPEIAVHCAFFDFWAAGPFHFTHQVELNVVRLHVEIRRQGLFGHVERFDKVRGDNDN